MSTVNYVFVLCRTSYSGAIHITTPVMAYVDEEVAAEATFRLNSGDAASALDIGYSYVKTPLNTHTATHHGELSTV